METEMNKYEKYIDCLMAPLYESAAKPIIVDGASKIVAHEAVKIPSTKAQERSQYARFVTEEYILSVQENAETGGKFIAVFAVMAKGGIAAVIRVPNEMLERPEFSKLQKKAENIYNKHVK